MSRFRLVGCVLAASLAVSVSWIEGLAQSTSVAASRVQADPLQLQERDILAAIRGASSDIQIHRWRRTDEGYEDTSVSVPDPSGAGVDAIQAHPPTAVFSLSLRAVKPSPSTTPRQVCW